MDALKAERARRQVGVKVISLDEMWTYAGARVGEKRNDLWVWTATEERDGGIWMDFEVDYRNKATLMRLLEQLPDAEQDGLGAYRV